MAWGGGGKTPQKPRLVIAARLNARLFEAVAEGRPSSDQRTFEAEGMEALPLRGFQVTCSTGALSNGILR